LVRYGSRQISFLTLNPFKWCAIFQNYRRSVAVRYGMLGYGMVRYGALKFRISSHSLLYTNHNTVNTRKYVHGVISEKNHIWTYLNLFKSWLTPYLIHVLPCIFLSFFLEIEPSTKCSFQVE
jgi:hypothetical protein